jgi:hypothetical protein
LAKRRGDDDHMSTSKDPITRLIEAIEAGSVPPTDLFADDADFDATVPDWRFQLRGAAAISSQLAEWFYISGTYEELRRTPLPDGELVEFTLAWEEHGVPHACHQAHVVRVDDEKIVADTVFCGGRWSAALLAEMAASQAARDVAERAESTAGT